MSIKYVAIDLNKKINFILSIYLKRFQTIIEEQWQKICWQLESNKYNVLYQNFAKSRVYKLGESYLIKNNSISNVIMFVPQRGYYRLINWLIFGV
jgi:translation initiation factor 2 alpha subunit (eIF-2alpha)